MDQSKTEIDQYLLTPEDEPTEEELLAAIEELIEDEISEETDLNEKWQQLCNMCTKAMTRPRSPSTLPGHPIPPRIGSCSPQDLFRVNVLNRHQLN